jgi:isopentenyl-diphosphate delta-isomerase
MKFGASTRVSPYSLIDLLERMSLLTLPSLSVDYILLIQADVTLKPNPNEVENYQYISREDLPALLEKFKKEGQPITPWFRLVVSKFLYDWWGDLKNLDKKTPDMTIHRMLD